jgi:aryl-alcohol dehydrogenase-like predicted oxidoreductase
MRASLAPKVEKLTFQHIFDSVQASLKRLQLDYIDLLQCHRFDYDTPIEETMQALHDVVQKGWVRYIGMSSCFAYQFHAMQSELTCLAWQCMKRVELTCKDYAINNKLTPFVSMQNFHNAAYREEEREMVPTLKVRHPLPSYAGPRTIADQQLFGAGMIPWSPLCRGFLARPWNNEGTKRTASDT